MVRPNSLDVVKPRLPLLLGVAGAVAVLAGIAMTVALLVLRSSCTSNAYQSFGADLSAAGGSCRGYTTDIHWSYFAIVLGGILFIASALSATNLGRPRSGGKSVADPK
jgi:hypothetical protein